MDEEGWYKKYAAQAPSLETIGAPQGCSGVHCVPNAGQAVGFIRPDKTSPARQTPAWAGISTYSRVA